MPIATYTERDLRVQFLSDRLVRLEVKGPKGFEDRPSFTVVNRNWGSVPFRQVGNRLITTHYTVQLPANRVGLKGIRILNAKGKLVYEVDALPGKSWLPAPAKTGPVFAMADAPRLIPPKGGPIPANLNGEFGSTSGYDTKNNAPDLYLFITSDAKTLRKDFLKLTGPIPLVPRYTFGYWDSRWFPYSDTMALASIDEYKKRDLPLDLFVVDTDWRVGASKGYGVNTKLFPDMPGFLKSAHDRDVRVMFNDHPEPQTATALDPKETMYRWNGLTSVLNMGLDVWWYDRNWSTRLRDPMPGLNAEVWGASLFQDITAAVRPNQRPLIMANVDGIDNGKRNRPPHAAFHRFPIPWTGDTASTWRALHEAVENGVDEGLLGLLPYVHEDAGGHQGTPEPELYARFMQYCALSPVLRVHCTYGLNRYPWSFGPQAEEATIEAIRFRYSLIPTIYSASHRVTTDGTPILRRLDLEFPKYEEATDNHQYLLGDDLLVAPVIDSVKNGLDTLKGTFQVEYFNNKNLQGSPVSSEEVSAIDFDWGQGGPKGAGSNNFSLRATGEIGPFDKSFTTTLGTSTDDGVRLYIDDKPVIDQWRPLDSAINTAKFTFEAGRTYTVRFEYFEADGGANAHLQWAGIQALSKGQKRGLWVPPGTWIDPWTGRRWQGPQKIEVPVTLRKVPLLIRDGGTLFLGDNTVLRSDEQLKKPLTLETWPGAKMTRELVEDDGISVKPVVQRRTVTTQRSGKQITLRVSGAPAARQTVVRVHLRGNESASKVLVNGKAVTFRTELPTAGTPGLGNIFGARGGQVVQFPLSLAGGKAASVVVSLR